MAPKLPLVFSVTSGKGGVGKTNISANIACCLAKSGKRVVLLLPSGEQLRMPLHSFLPSEQQRIKTFLGVLEIPGPLRSEFKLAESQLEAARSLLNDQAITPEEFNLRKTAVLQAFLRACAAQSLAEDSDMVQRLLRKLES